MKFAFRAPSSTIYYKERELKKCSLFYEIFNKLLAINLGSADKVLDKRVYLQ